MSPVNQLHNRRAALKRLGLLAAASVAAPLRSAERSGKYRLATFSADVTVPLGHGMMGGSWVAKKIADPLYAHGIVLLGGERPVVIAVLDWCEIRNDALTRWQEVLAEAAGTRPDHVMVSAIHQHDAPVADLEAERILRARGAKGSVCDLEFHERAVQSAARALRDSLRAAQPVTHVGTGRAKVEKISSNRRYEMPDGSVRFDRGSATKNTFAIAAPENLIDPWLKTLSFWNGEMPLAALSGYAVHPMSYYRLGEVSSDFPGLARARRQSETPGVKQIYFSGCSGNVTAGKYNDGTRENRPVLADRLYRAMVEAWNNTRRHELKTVQFRTATVRFEPREGPGFSLADLEDKVAKDPQPFQQCLAAMALSWRKRTDAGHRITLPLLDLGLAQYLVLPGEAYVEYQLAAQRELPNSFVLVAGYGEGATGYIPTEQHIAEKDPNLNDWWWVAPGSEARLLAGIHDVLQGSK